ncbi:preprotein translocase subunit SecG [Thiohalophilus sp.]|uniref:preprotein translocase subunit SecG n=1 Tax=Thiohalophilus sp. TaxID=3028392 RepID=UPI002ACED11F|nr:preprotein translocase subunit SecG [Thiohalophilus sp.]MDZ7662573.1 preprotein translocase subunit SecG [Thiohalophilus sp.]MDZ7802672.1 preprotein translocase subunit SecG [Thiohalophilus sp.]
MLYNIILVLHVIVAVTLVVMVLLQQGKGADAGAAFGGGGGGGASGTMFGSRGAANFLTRFTAVLAFLFFGLSLALFTLAGDVSKPESIVDQAERQSQESTVPAAPESAAPEDGAPVDVPKSE